MPISVFSSDGFLNCHIKKNTFLLTIVRRTNPASYIGGAKISFNHYVSVCPLDGVEYIVKQANLIKMEHVFILLRKGGFASVRQSAY